MEAKNFPIQSARWVSSGITSDTLVTQHTFSNVDRPWQANISQKRAHKVGTRWKTSLALVNRLSSTSMPLFVLVELFALDCFFR